MITYRTYEQLTPVYDICLCKALRNIITKCVTIIDRILQYRELSLERAPCENLTPIYDNDSGTSKKNDYCKVVNIYLIYFHISQIVSRKGP